MHVPLHPPPQEALPTPFGLVRSGVAPDHADTKVGWRGWRAARISAGAARRLGAPPPVPPPRMLHGRRRLAPCPLLPRT